ncbi:hypothetical protein PQX77_020145 [Marasmius sp. AFHP31]|nr:hypothetical protein PQX77_020145 [Marasmius sp. AFHP31]
MLDLQKYFGKNLFNGHDFLQVYEPAMEGVSKAKGLWENLTGEDKNIPHLEDTVTTETVGTGTQAGTRIITTPPSKLEIAEWNAKHAPWKKDSNMLEGFMQLTMTRETYISIDHMTVTDAINIPGLVKALILVQAIPKVWEAPASKCLYNFYHEDDPKTDQERKDADPGRKPALTLDCVQDTIMADFEQLNPQFAGRLTALKCGGSNAPLFQQPSNLEAKFLVDLLPWSSGSFCVSAGTT